jgi:hypothetical protein
MIKETSSHFRISASPGFKALPFGPLAVSRRFLKYHMRRAFTTAEIVVTCVLLMCLMGYAFPVAQSVSERLFNPYSDYNVEREIKEAAEWVSGQLHKSRALRENITILVNAGEASPSIKISRSSSPIIESWTGNSIAFKVSSSSSFPSAFSYTYNFQHQTLTPALRLDVYRKDSAGSGYGNSGVDIVVSGHGLVHFEGNV